MKDPLSFPCPHCQVLSGVRCKNYLGKGKQPCPDRGKPTVTKTDDRPKPETQPSLFDDTNQE